MKYTEYLQTLDHDKCPFCAPEQRVYRKNDAAYLTYALAPYHRHHLLIIPNRHVLSMLEMSEVEHAQLWHLNREGMETMRKLGYENLSVLVREGKVGAIKSVAHLHYHIIPNHRIGDLDINGEARKILTEEEVQEISKELLAVMPLD
jgi:diadenosine tetraphosphate (Ap4A) HIT family hydrolase